MQPRDFLRTVEDVHDLIHRLNTVLHQANYAPLETLLDPAGFSGLISRTVASRLAAASHRLVVNAFHNGYPDLIVQGQYPRDRIQHGEGLEVKASRSDSNWQSHGPRGGWFAGWMLRLADLTKELDGLPYPVQVQVWFEPLGRRHLAADLGNAAFEAAYPPLTLDEIAAGKRRPEPEVITVATAVEEIRLFSAADLRKEIEAENTAEVLADIRRLDQARLADLVQAP